MVDVGLPLLDQLQGVSPTTPETAIAIAPNVRKTFGADIGFAAQQGPAPGQEGHIPGLVHLALVTTDGTDVKLPGDRHRVSPYVVISLLNLLQSAVSTSSTRTA